MSDNKNIILITGTTSGIGYETASILASNPSNHVILTGRSPTKGQSTLASLQACHPAGTLSFQPLEVTSDLSIAEAAKAVALDHGRIDVFVSNAGIAPTGTPLHEQLTETMEANAVGPALVWDAFKPLLLRGKPGVRRAIFVTSGLGSIALRNNSVAAGSHMRLVDFRSYRMSKSALNMLAECCRAEVEPQGVKVQLLCPGYVDTNLTGPDDRPARRQRGALTPEESAAFVVSVVEGKRDADIGKVIQKDGTWPY